MLPEIDEARRRTRLTPVRRRWRELASRHFAAFETLARWCPLYVPLQGPPGPDPGDACAFRDVLQLALVRALRGYVYASARVESLGRSIGPRIVGCGATKFTLACGCRFVQGEYTCKQSWLCFRCRKSSSKKYKRKLTHALDAALAGERERFTRDSDVARLALFSPRRRRARRKLKHGGFGYKLRHLAGVFDSSGSSGFRETVRIVMMTVAVRHSGNVGTDRARIVEGLRYFRKKYHARWGRYPYAQLWEVTPGRDAEGHVHAHVAMMIPWRPYGTLRSWFISGAGRDDAGVKVCEHVHFATGYSKKGTRGKVASSGRSAAGYLAKYVSKGVDVAGFTAELRADVSAAFYNQRKVSTSRRFWVPVAKCCGECGEDFEKIDGDARWEWSDATPATGPPAWFDSVDWERPGFQVLLHN